MKGSADDVSRRVHSILRNSLDDIAGDHIVLKLARDENTLKPFMYVHRTPLASNLVVSFLPLAETWHRLPPLLLTLGRSQVNNATASNNKDPIESIYLLSQISSRQTGGKRGWLHDLESDMRSEQPMVDRLYPLSTPDSGTGNKWACPLLRFAFWSKVHHGVRCSLDSKSWLAVDSNKMF